jgi:hypothetical protein
MKAQIYTSRKHVKQLGCALKKKLHAGWESPSTNPSASVQPGTLC